MTLHSPLDIESILFVDVAGGAEVASFLVMLIFAFVFAKYSFPAKIVLPLYALAALVMAQYMAGLYVLAVILASIAIGYSIAKVIR